MADASSILRRVPHLADAPTVFGGVALSLASPAARFVLRGPTAAAEAAAAVFGVRPPEAINTSATGPKDRAALKIGPDEWLLVAPDSDPEALFAELEATIATPHSLVDVSHRQTAILAAGAGASLALNAAVPLDLSIEAFPLGAATRTIFEKAEIVLWRAGPDSFRIEVWRSFSSYVLELLKAACAENAAS